MKLLLNNWYKNHALVYKVLLLVFTTVFIVYLFPKTGKFKYSFEKGKPWQSESLYAPFNFAIKKSASEIDKEKQSVKNSSAKYFEINTAIPHQVDSLFITAFNSVFSDNNSKSNAALLKKGRSVLHHIYANGLLAESHDFDSQNMVVLTTENTLFKKILYKDVFKAKALKGYLESQFNTSDTDVLNRLTSLFFDLVIPNVTFNKELTQNIELEALSKISSTRGSIEKGTIIITKGQVVEDKQFNILTSLKSEFESQVWNTTNYNWVLMAYTLLVALTLLMLLLFLNKYRLDIYNNNIKVTFIFFNISVMIGITTLVINFNSQYIYVVPLCVLPLVLKAFFDARLGLFTHVLTVLLLGFIVPNSYEYMFLQIIAGIVTILTVSELYKRANLFISVGQITIIYIIAYFAFFVIHEGQVTTISWNTFGMFILCGLATLFVQPLIYIYEKLFGLVSDVSLLELSDTNSKLLKQLSNKAPGTFHHSLSVANLAEAAANEIGANTMLVRVGALYHDIGKMKNPTFFTENQNTGLNPHKEFSPSESAQIILNHVIHGIEIAKKHKLPDRVIDFIRTHHGTSLVYYFYHKEKEDNIHLNSSDFRYSGPKPFSKETAILMMCDSVEAASKSLKEPTATKIDAFVESIINKQIENGQFLNANITFKEIELIKKVLKHKLSNIYHLRIEYPE